VKKIGKEFVQHLHENDRIAVVGFAETAEMLLPLSPIVPRSIRSLTEPSWARRPPWAKL
jgi:hypothetical protein